MPKKRTAAPEQPQKLRVHIRWMIRRDMPEVLGIEALCFNDFAWTEDDLIRCLRQRNCIGMVAEYDERILGFMVYELHKCKLQLCDFAVLPSMQRRGIGAQMADKLKLKLSEQRRTRIVTELHDANLDGQLFFRAQGFTATRVLRGFWDCSDDDAYEFVYRYQPVV